MGSSPNIHASPAYPGRIQKIQTLRLFDRQRTRDLPVPDRLAHAKSPRQNHASQQSTLDPSHGQRTQEPYVAAPTRAAPRFYGASLRLFHPRGTAEIYPGMYAIYLVYNPIPLSVLQFPPPDKLSPRHPKLPTIVALVSIPENTETQTGQQHRHHPPSLHATIPPL